MNSLYSLTNMTGKKASADRTRVVGTVEMKARTYWVVMGSLLPAMAVAGIFAPVIKEYALMVVPVVIALALVLFNRRQRDGLQLYTYSALRDRYGRGSRDKLYQLTQCHMPLDVSKPRLEVIAPSSTPRPATADAVSSAGSSNGDSLENFFA